MGGAVVANANNDNFFVIPVCLVGGAVVANANNDIYSLFSLSVWWVVL